MRGLVASAEAREAAAKDDMAALQAARSSLLETPRPAAAHSPARNPDLRPPGAPQAPDSSAASGAAPSDVRPDDASASQALRDADEQGSMAGIPAVERSGQNSTAADLGDAPAPWEGAAALHLPARAPVGALNLALASAAADADAYVGDGGGGESAQGPEAALHAAIAEAEARRTTAKKQFTQLRSVCIGAQQARMALFSLASTRQVHMRCRSLALPCPPCRRPTWAVLAACGRASKFSAFATSWLLGILTPGPAFRGRAIGHRAGGRSGAPRGRSGPRPRTPHGLRAAPVPRAQRRACGRVREPCQQPEP